MIASVKCFAFHSIFLIDIFDISYHTVLQYIKIHQIELFPLFSFSPPLCNNLLSLPFRHYCVNTFIVFLSSIWNFFYSMKRVEFIYSIATACYTCHACARLQVLLSFFSLVAPDFFINIFVKCYKEFDTRYHF